MHLYLEAISSLALIELIQLLEFPRVTFLDLSYLDNDSRPSLLHEAARRQYLCLIELTVRAGADVFIRNRNGKVAHEGAGDDRVECFRDNVTTTSTCQWISLFSRQSR